MKDQPVVSLELGREIAPEFGTRMESRNLLNWVSSKASTLFSARPEQQQQQN